MNGVKLSLMKRLLLVTCLSLPLALATFSPSALAVPMPEKPEATAADLTPAVTSSSQIWESVIALPDGRLVLEAPRWLGNPNPQLSIATVGGMPAPYPDADWNATEGDPAKRFVALTSMTRAADGTLWLVDSGVPDREAKPEAPAKLIQIDPATGQVKRSFPVSADALRDGSILAGIAVHEQTAYVADSGVPGILVIDLESGVARRFLDHVEGLTAKRPIVTPSGEVKARDGRPLAIDATLVAISPDGQWLYVQSYCGPLYRIATRLFDDPDSTNTALQESATLWYKTRALGGLTVGPDGTLYWSDVTTGSIDSYTPGRIPHHLITDPRLKWPGGLSLSTTPSGNTLFVPAAQLDQAARFQNGQTTVQWPVTVYSFHVPEDATSDVLRK
ncbi:gluconolactonase [Acetobacter aceti NRIC 0242]|uniref:Gluconolactonase n=1 Tax=Acetobacter aceti NBRC 14818 TaxID=887700 RepID=A0AB33IE45_ACEAC|nr:L-dopachrome tautomerase-related protein [Acetobacter aceti]TCS33133.1 sugar lactone lactonase YvrE [Acetobacter aceti NBRC 14818]BCK75809.1 gluconolactonase [Acetobacter aceti NBRC 14818]GAN57988.1 gluconolactonase [Acetobacter aceti NBRC 14818]GBO80617.1 gluconolactonase [Acetobacter aceti NRIC 0242]